MPRKKSYDKNNPATHAAERLRRSSAWETKKAKFFKTKAGKLQLANAKTRAARIAKLQSHLPKGTTLKDFGLSATGTKPIGKAKSGKVSNQLAGGVVHVEAHTRSAPGGTIGKFKKIRF